MNIITKRGEPIARRLSVGPSLSLHVLDHQLESKDDLYEDEYAKCYH